MKIELILQVLVGIFAAAMYGFLIGLIFDGLLSTILAIVGGAAIGQFVIGDALVKLFGGNK